MMSYWESMSMHLARTQREAARPRYYVAPDAYDDPTIWRDYGPDDHLPHALLTRTDANAELFGLVVDLLKGVENPEGGATYSCPT